MGTAPFGADPVFISTSSLFVAGANASQYYAPHQINERNVPFGFFADAAAEYSLFFDVAFDASHADKLLSYMQQGFFLDQFTDTVRLEAFTYNAALKVFAVSRVELQFQAAGTIEASTTIDTLSLELYDSFYGISRQTLEIIFVAIVRGLPPWQNRA